MNDLFLGIDTSNYTTSLALVDASGVLCGDFRQVLQVKEGGRGLRQSEALYQHIVNLPKLMEEAAQVDNLKERLRGVAVSDRPRPLTDSYMPVFRGGILLARSLGATLSVPVIPVSHQEGHIRAALYGCGREISEVQFPLLATHFSGGTSEILQVKNRGTGFDCKILGETLDLNAGQLVDRIGVHLGLTFPAGRELEKLAAKAKSHDCVIPSTVKGLDFHFSGQENKAMQYLKEGVPPEEVAFGVLRAIAKTLSKTIGGAISQSGVQDVVFSGGVMSNQIIKKIVEKELARKRVRLHFTKPQYATDNAVGVALMGLETLMKKGDGDD